MATAVEIEGEWSNDPAKCFARQLVLNFLKTKIQDDSELERLLIEAAWFPTREHKFKSDLGYYYEDVRIEKGREGQIRRSSLWSRLKNQWKYDTSGRYPHSEAQKESTKKLSKEREKVYVVSRKLRNERIETMRLVYIAAVLELPTAGWPNDRHLPAYISETTKKQEYIGLYTSRLGHFGTRRGHFLPSGNTIMKDLMVEDVNAKCFEVKVVLCQKKYAQGQLEAYLMMVAKEINTKYGTQYIITQTAALEPSLMAKGKLYVNNWRHGIPPIYVLVDDDTTDHPMPWSTLEKLTDLPFTIKQCEIKERKQIIRGQDPNKYRMIHNATVEFGDKNFDPEVDFSYFKALTTDEDIRHELKLYRRWNYANNSMNLIYIAAIVSPPRDGQWPPKDRILEYIVDRNTTKKLYIGITISKRGNFGMRDGHFSRDQESPIYKELESHSNLRCYELKTILCENSYIMAQGEAFLTKYGKGMKELEEALVMEGQEPLQGYDFWVTETQNIEPVLKRTASELCDNKTALFRITEEREENHPPAWCTLGNMVRMPYTIKKSEVIRRRIQKDGHVNEYMQVHNPAETFPPHVRSKQKKP